MAQSPISTYSEFGIYPSAEARSMHVLVVDDSADLRALVRRFLHGGGFAGISEVVSAEEAYDLIGLTNRDSAVPVWVDLILMDIDLPGASGIQACRRIKSDARFRDVPIVVITASNDMALLRQSFAVGASDYITKPIHRVEFLARVDSACRLKVEMDRRKERERELLEVKMGLQRANQELARANQELERLSRADALTGIANRRLFDEIFEREWDRARRNQSALSLALVDIDEFKLYNDTYGHQRGDACLRAVAQALDSQVRRSSDLVARYGGEEFAAILPGVGEKEALDMAWSLNRLVADQRIEHESSRVSDLVTVSVGIATTIPSSEQTPTNLIAQADEALYRSKATGKNRVTHARDMAAETGPGAR